MNAEAIGASLGIIFMAGLQTCIGCANGAVTGDLLD